MFKRIGMLRRMPDEGSPSSSSPHIDKRISTSRDQHDKIQKKTFTKWINYHLETHNSSRQVEDLFEDLRDGVLLCHLIEVLTGEALPVHKGRVSKRVHHISNLTTALTVLRRRGLELINNNPTDLADGNPRIVLGLVWQMILYFQIETNIQLLNEWGFEATAPLQAPSTSSTPLTPISKLKGSADRVILRWVAAEIAKKHGIIVNDMDKGWRDGVAFNALVHRSRPELIDMELVKRSTPRENVERAFRLAEEHLNIRPLLDVEDVLCDKPDKRSIITYVSQFIRVISNLRLIEPQPLVQPSLDRFRNLIQWISNTYQIALSFDLKSDLYAQYQHYLTLRKDFNNRKPEFAELSKTRDSMPEDEWRKNLDQWYQISRSLDLWRSDIERQLPCPLAELATWISESEQLISSPIALDKSEPKKSLQVISKQMELHESHFADYPRHLEKFHSIYNSGKVEGKFIPASFLESLRLRVESLNDASRDRIRYLNVLTAFYRLLEFVKQLNSKMEAWKSFDSLKGLNRSIREYNEEITAAPERKQKILVDDLQIIAQKKPSRENADLLREAESLFRDTTLRFRDLSTLLDEQYRLWRDFEMHTKRLDDELDVIERERLKIDPSLHTALRKCEQIADQIGKNGSNEAKNSVNEKVDRIRNRFKALAQQTAGGRLVVDFTVPSTSSAAVSPIQGTHLQKWMNDVEELVQTKISNAEEAANLLEAFAQRQTEIPTIESERIAIMRKLKNAQKEELNAQYRTLRNEIPMRKRTLKIVISMVSSVETYLKTVEEWTKTYSFEDEKNKNEFGKEAEILKQIDSMVDAFDSPDYASVIETAPIRNRVRKVKTVVVTIETIHIEKTVTIIEEKVVKLAKHDSTRERQSTLLEEVEKGLEQLEMLRERGVDLEPVTNRISAIQSEWTELNREFEQEEQMRTGVLNDLIAQKGQILSRVEATPEELRTSVVTVEAINFELKEFEDSPQLAELEERWQKKRVQVEKLLEAVDQLGRLEERYTNAEHAQCVVLEGMIADCGVLEHCLLQVELNSPLKSSTKLRTSALRDLISRKRNVQNALVRKKLGEKIRNLEMTGEEDISVALEVLKDIYQEAIVLYHSSKEHQRENEQLDSDLKRVEALLSRKMEFFQRLEQLYDIVQELRRQNNDWKVINASEIDDVHAKIVELLEQSRKEFLPNGDSLEAEIEAINTSFFRSEYESIRDKFYTLRHELLEQCRLLEARNQFLGTVKAFCQLADRVDSTLKGLSGRGDSSFDENEIQRLTNELSELLSDVDSLGNKMIAEQNVADMTVKGVGMDEVLLRLRGAVPSAPSTVTRNRFDELEEFVGAVSSTCSVNSMDTKTDPIIATYTYILEQQAASSKEKDLVDEMEKVAESDDRREKLTRLRLKLRSRDEERTSKIEDAVSRFLAAIRKRYLGLDEHISKLISSGDKQLVDKVDSGPWSQWKVSLSEVERAVADSDIAQPLRSKVHDDFGKLEKDAFETDNKIRRFNEQWRRKQEKRKKLLLKLDAFGKWLDSIEEDLKKVEECGEDTERKNLEFRKLQENCLAYNRLVEKMENTNFDGGEQRIVDEYLRRYCDLTKKFDKDYLPRAHVVPITVDTKMSSMASDAPSMLSTGSASSVEPESTQVAERHLFEGASNLDSDGRSVEVLSQLNAVKSTKDVRNLLDKVAKICSDAVDDQYTIINSYGLKNVEEAEDDLNRLSQIRFTSKVWQKELVVLTGKLGHADSDLAKQLIHSFEVMDEPNQTLAKVLASEIEDEKALCSNYQKIMTGLNEIEETARNGDECITATTRRRLYSLEMNIDMLHLQCKEPRKYVRSSIDNSSKTSSPTRRKRIAVMVTSTVTTVIKVIEERLRLSPAGPDSEENKELAKLMRDLSILNNNVTKKNYADFEVPKLLEDLVSLTDSAKGIYDKIEKVRKQQGANDPKNTDRILTVARSGRAGLEDIVKKVDRIPVPAELTAQYRSVIVDLIDSILRIEDEMLLQPENLQGQNKVSEMLHMSEASRHQESTIVRSEKAAEACDISERYPMEAQRGEAVKETETSIKSMDVSQVQLIKPVLDLLSGSYQKPRNADVQKIQDERVQPSNNLVKERAEKDVANDEPRITAVQSKETELQNIIDPLKDNKQKRLIKENIESLVVQVDNAVRDAEAVEWNPEASLDEITGAIEKLNKANDDIGAMQSCYDKIDSAEPENDSLRASALAKIETADQTVAPLKQALEDRLEKLNNELANLEKISGECKLAERDVNLAVASNASPDEFQAIVDSRLKPLEESLSAQQLSLTPLVVEKRDAVEKSLKDMREQTEKAINDAQEQQDLVDSLNDAINLVQSEVDQLREKYTESPRPLAESLKDSKKLKELLEKLVTVPVADIKIKPEREYLTRLADSVKSSIKELSGPLDTDARKEEDVLKNFNDTLTDLTAVGDAVLAFDPVAPADSAEARATQADVVSDLNEKLRQLKSRAENVHKDVEQPSKNIARNPEISKDNLPERVAQLQDELNKKKGDMAKRHVLDNVTPEVVAASDALQKRIDDVEQVPLGSIEDQEKTLNDLEKMKRQLETALEKVPEGPEGDELRARSQWDLSRLNDLLKRLSDAVGDKLAALAAFTATKDDVNAELDKIKTNNDKLKQKKTSDDEEPNPQSLTDRLEALKNQKSELDRLKNKVDNVDKSSLDSNSVAEIEALQKRIADVADEIAKNEKDAEKQLRDKLDSERQDAEAKRLLDDLAALMDRARQTLTDASALPTLYESLGKELEDATANASKTIEDIEPSKRDSGNVSQLLGQLPKASTVAEQINKRFAAWLDFVRERDLTVNEIDRWNVFIESENSRPLLSLEEAETNLEVIKQSYADFARWKVITTQNLDNMAETIVPMEVPFNDNRFIQVALESSDQEFEKLLDALFTEYRVEEELQHERNLIEEEVSEMEGRCVLLIDDNDIDGLRRLLFELNSVGAHISQLIQDVASGVENRSFVAIGAGIDGEALRSRVDAVEVRVRGITSSLSPSETDAESPVVSPPEGYDVEAAAEILAALYPNEHPRHVLREHGIDDDGLGDTESESQSDFSALEPPKKSDEEALVVDVEGLDDSPSSSNTVGLLSPIPDDPVHDAAVNQALFRRQRSRWRRILRTALPLQAMLVLLLGAACLVPHCDDDYCCMLLNRFANSFDPSLEFVNGPPPF